MKKTERLTKCIKSIPPRTGASNNYQNHCRIEVGDICRIVVRNQNGYILDQNGNTICHEESINGKGRFELLPKDKQPILIHGISVTPFKGYGIYVKQEVYQNYPKFYMSPSDAEQYADVKRHPSRIKIEKWFETEEGQKYLRKAINRG